MFYRGSSCAAGFPPKARGNDDFLDHLRVAADQLTGSKDRYKIKLRSAGFRLVYEVRDELVLVIVIAFGKKERSAVYQAAQHRH